MVRPSENINQYLKERSDALIEACKQQLGGCCSRCSETENLQFHHIDPSEKLFNISNARSFSFEAVQAELLKCVLLCLKCHKAEHAAKCGSIRAYENGCRCDDCRLAKREKNRRYQAKRKRG